MTVSSARPTTRSLVAALVAVAAALLAASVAVAATRPVAIVDFVFSPKTMTINAGDRVRWTNSDTVAHTATASNGSFDTGLIDPGGSASVRFTQAGTYRYICTPHTSMTGTIRVRAASAGTTAPPTIPPTDVIVPGTPPAEPDTAQAMLVAAFVLVVVGFVVPRRRRSS